MIGPQDIWVGLALGMFFFGAEKLPELSRSLGAEALRPDAAATPTKPEERAPR